MNANNKLVIARLLHAILANNLPVSNILLLFQNKDIKYVRKYLPYSASHRGITSA